MMAVKRSVTMDSRSSQLSGKESAGQKLIRGHLGSLEADLMQLLWDQPEGLTVRDLVRALPGRPRAYTTVMTVTARLHEKGLLERSPLGRAYVYRPALSRDEFLHRLSSERVRSLIAEFGELAVAHFVGEVRQLPRSEIERIREMLREGE
jgi:predicted transcriptional regulator